MQEMPTIDTAVRREIESRLAALAGEEGVRLLMAVESGSRAWGFPSPDSDYDVRFLYVRSTRDYLSLTPKRDVVERPIVDEIDLNGWDIRKALGLLLRHNATLSEWLQSPIRYIADDPVIARLRDLADRHFDPRGYALHYSSLGRNNADRWLDRGAEISVKRYFYALRPALAIRALRLDPTCRPPMQLQQLIAVCDLDPGLTNEIERLVDLKAITREAGNSTRLPQIEALVTDELARAGEVPDRHTDETFAEEADALFLELVEEQ